VLIHLVSKGNVNSPLREVKKNMHAHQLVSTSSQRQPFPLPTSRHDGKPADALSQAFETFGAVVRFDRNVEIYGEEEPAEYFYQVVSGAVRTYKVLSDGRRQIGAFYLPGEVFGLEAGQNHRFSAEAIAASTIRVVRRSALIALAARDHNLANELWTRTANSFQCAQDHMMLLGRKNAEERVASFLLQMAERSSTERTVELPMSRLDIADYLGLTIETVSRTMTHLEGNAMIELAGSRSVRLNRPALQRLNA
jgi:CRP/FNR family transcriptional regulator, nitrogen fixation regulation protein